ncbi:MAG: hypothetical protein H6851_14270 [Geminicoccaceae bacterium]|nr:hypothetical protein [Geminicoccaceae bacterium]
MAGMTPLPPGMPLMTGNAASGGEGPDAIDGLRRDTATTANLRRLDLTVADAMGRQVVTRGQAGQVALELSQPVPGGTRLTVELPAAGRPRPGMNLPIVEMDGKPTATAQSARVIDIRTIDTVPARPGPVVQAQLLRDGSPVQGASIDIRIAPRPLPAASPPVMPAMHPPVVPSPDMSPPSAGLPRPAMQPAAGGMVVAVDGRPSAWPAVNASHALSAAAASPPIAPTVTASPAATAPAPATAAMPATVQAGTAPLEGTARSPVLPSLSRSDAVADGQAATGKPVVAPDGPLPAKPVSPSAGTVAARTPFPPDGSRTAPSQPSYPDVRSDVTLRVQGHMIDGRPLLGLGQGQLRIEVPMPDLPDDAIVGVSLVSPVPAAASDGGSTLEDGVEMLMRALMIRAGADRPTQGQRLPVDERLAQRLISRDDALRRSAETSDRADAPTRHGHAPAERPLPDTARPPILDSGPEGWRGFAGMLGDQDPGVPLSQWLRRGSVDDRGRSVDDDHDHMAMTLELSEIGRVRIDLYLDGSILRAAISTERPLSPAIRMNIADLFGAALELTGHEGQIVFRNDRRHTGQPVHSHLSTRSFEA